MREQQHQPAGRHLPSRRHQRHDEPEYREDGHQGAPQVVEHLPDAEAIQSGVAAEDPRQQLPVAPHPTVLPLGVDLVAGRVFLDHLDVGDQAGSGIVAFQQVMRQDGVLRNPVTQGGLERVNLIDALAAERSATEEILVDVGDGHRVGRQTALGGVDRLEGGSVVDRRQARGDSRLEHREAAADLSAGRVDHRLIQGVRDLSDQLLRGVARQPGVGVECDHVAEAAGDSSLESHVAGARGAAQVGVELHQLAALALPAHPGVFARIPAPFAVEEQEPVTILLVQGSDPVPGEVEQGLVVRGVFGGGVGPVGRRSKIDLPVIVCQEVHLQGVHQLIDTVGRGDHGRHHDQGAQRVRHPIAQLKPRTCGGGQYPRKGIVQQGKHQFAGRAAGQHGQRHDHADRQVARQGGHRPQQQTHDKGGREQQAADVAGQTHRLDQADSAFPQRRPVTEVGFEAGQPIIDQPEADVATHIIG